jgi:pimeloyl-ACP methyl ester carboxylesterase
LIPEIPSLINELYEGRPERFEQFFESVDGSFSRFADGMHYSVVCHDFGNMELKTTALSHYNDFTEYAPLSLLEQVYGTIDACKSWSGAKASSSFNANVSSDIPTLLLSGEFDPITPVSKAQSAQSQLTNSHHFVIAATGHGASVEPCGEEILLNFINDPSTLPEHKCLDEVADLKFTTSKSVKSKTDTLLEEFESYPFFHL